jgi:hypothetical protein
MQIVESWEDHNANSYAIVRYSKKELKPFPHTKKHEAMWLDDMTSTYPELWSFGGSVGQRIADFDTIQEAQDFLLKDISEYDKKPEIRLQMIAVKPTNGKNI